MVKSYSITGNTIEITISKLEGDQSIYFSIPCTVSTQAAGTVFANTNNIIGYNEISLTPEQYYKSNTTYHALEAETMPDPTGYNAKTLAYILVFIGIATTLGFVYVIDKKRKSYNK